MKTRFTKFFSGRWQMFISLFFIVSVAVGQGVPEYMYFKFDAPGNQQNYASAPVGSNPAPIVGMTIGGTGQFGTAMIGDNVYLDGVNTGWATNLPATGWTISMWLNNMPSNTDLNYLFGDVNAAAFRCFIGGAAGAGAVLLRRTGWTDVLVNGVAPGPIVLTFVYTGSSIKYYKNGVPSGTVAETNAAVTGTGPFYVGCYNASPYGGVPLGGLMDEFRMYNRALTDLEISQTWNQPLPLGGPPVVVTTAASAITSTTATMNGTVNANGASTTVTFEYGLTTTYGTVVPGNPPTVTGNTVTPVLANLTGLTPATLYHYRVNGVNSYGTTNGNDMTFTTLAALPVVVTMAATGVGATIATLNGTVNPGGASTTVTFDYGLTTTYGSSIAGVPSPVTGNSVIQESANLTGLTLGLTYHYRIKAVNVIGTANGLDMSFTTSNCPMPSGAGPITGPTSVCGNSTGIVYSVTPIGGATGYNWTVPPGALITGGNNTNSITVTFGSTSGNVSVYGTNSCGNGSSTTIAVTVNPAPTPTITGTTILCVNSGYYNYTTQAGQNTYIWAVSAGGTIIYGTGTNQIQVVWTAAGAQWVSVNYSTPAGCSAAVPTVLNVTVNNIPGPAGTITGTSTVCAGANGIPYSVAPVANAMAYVWTLPAGATIAAGGGTNIITVNFAMNASAGNITVFANNLCGNGATSPPFAVTINPLPDPAGTVTGTATVCQGQTDVNYMVSPVANATGYTWTVPPGATITSGVNTNNIMVNFSMTSASGNVAVIPTNSCGNGTVSPNFPVTVNAMPAPPVISIVGNQLMSSAPTGNQWYLWDVIIPGATDQTYTPAETGIYAATVTLNGCTSDLSDEIYFVMPLGFGESQISEGFGVYPNPGDGIFTIVAPSTMKGNYDILIFNTLGSTIYKLTGLSGQVQKIDFRPVTPGVYSIVLQNNTAHFVKKIVIK